MMLWRRLFQVTSSAAILWAAPACSDEPAGQQCVDPSLREIPGGPYASPAELVTDACQAGALADFDANGLWYFEQENRGIFSGAGPVRFDLSCSDGLKVEQAGSISKIEIKDSSLSDDHLFWRRARRFDDFDLTIVDAHLICGRTELGTYVGQAVRCTTTEEEGEQCETSGLSLTPFERLPGEAESEGMQLVSEFQGQEGSWAGDFVANVRVHQGRAYVVLGEGGMRIVDVRDPAAPVELGHWQANEGENINDIKIVSDGAGVPFALLASNERGMIVVDVQDPANARDIVAFTPSGEPGAGIHSIFTEIVDGKTLAYLADGYSNVVTIWDVSDPRLPGKHGQHTSENPDWAVHDLYADQGRMYLNATIGGMLVVDSKDAPNSPVEVGRFEPDRVSYSHANWVTRVGDRIVAVHGDEGYDAKFKIVDVDPASPSFLQEIGRYQTRPQVSAHNVMAFGSKAYAAYYQDGVRVLDLSDPTSPRLEAYYNTWAPERTTGGRFEGAVGLDVDLEAGLIYVADHPRGLMIFRLD